jgi:hypothetical protein
MTDKQLQAIEKHGRDLLAIFPNADERDPVKLCKKLRRLETAASAASVKYCNGESGDEEIDQAGLTAVCNACTILGDAQGRIWFNRDPRGYALKIDLHDGEALHRDWGGNGIIAPEIDRDGN